METVEFYFSNRYDPSFRSDSHEDSIVYVTTMIKQSQAIWTEFKRRANVSKLWGVADKVYFELQLGSLDTFRRMLSSYVFMKIPRTLALSGLGFGHIEDVGIRIHDVRYAIVFSDDLFTIPSIRESYCLRITVPSDLLDPSTSSERRWFLDKAVRVEGIPAEHRWANIFVLEPYDLTKGAKREWEGLNLIWAFYLNADGPKSHELKRNRTYGREYGLIREMIAKERPGQVYRWQNLCRELSSKSNLAEIRKYAQLLGLPPQTWNNPRLMCALMTPRVEDYALKVHCDNADEPTMEGDEVGSIPEYLKYTYVDAQGKVYCSNVLDLYKAIRSSQSREPYRRFAFTPQVKDDVEARYQWLRNVIEPHGLGKGIMAKIRDTARCHRSAHCERDSSTCGGNSIIQSTP